MRTSKNNKSTPKSVSNAKKSTTRSMTRKNSSTNNENEYGAELAPRMNRKNQSSKRQTASKKRTTRK